MPTVLLILSLVSVMLAYFLGLTKAELKALKPVTEEKITGKATGPVLITYPEVKV